MGAPGRPRERVACAFSIGAPRRGLEGAPGGLPWRLGPPGPGGGYRQAGRKLLAPGTLQAGAGAADPRPMALDLLALILVCVFAGFGAARGAFASAVGIARLLLATAAGCLLGPLLGPGLATAAELPGPAGTALAGTLAFLFFQVVLGLLARWLRRLEERRVGLTRTPVDRLGGAALGALRGGLAALPLVWMLLWVDVLRVAGIAPGLPELGPSRAVAATETAVETGTLALVGDDPGGRVTARLAARPAATIGQLEWLVSDPRVVDLRADPAFWDSVERGKIDAALARPSFEHLAGDAGLRRKLAAVGLVEAEVAEDPAA